MGAYVPRGVSHVHANRRREWVRRHLWPLTLGMVLDAIIVALSIGLACLLSLLGWLIYSSP